MYSLKLSRKLAKPVFWRTDVCTASSFGAFVVCKRLDSMSGKRRCEHEVFFESVRMDAARTLWSGVG